MATSDQGIRGFYLVLTTIKDELLSNPSIKTCTFGDITDIDLQKQTIFPLAHIIIDGATNAEKTLQFNFTVLTMEQIDTNNQLVDDVFDGEPEENLLDGEGKSHLSLPSIENTNANINKKNKKVNYLKKVSIVIDSKVTTSKLRKGLKTGQAIGQGMNIAKDLANLPGNVCTPSYLATNSRSAANKYPKLTC